MLVGVIGAGLGIKGATTARATPPQPTHHLGDDVILADQQPIGGERRGQMPVAEMPGQPQQGRPAWVR